MDARDPFPRRTATPARLAPWLFELAVNAPGLVASYLPGAGIDPRTRERVIMAVTEVNGCRYCAWIHGSWQEYLGDVDRATAEDALLTYARACAEAGRPLDAAPLLDVLTPDGVRAVRATVAQIEVSNLVGNTVDGLLARLTRKRPLDPLAAAQEAVTVAAAIPLAVPLLAAGGMFRAVGRAAPPLPEIVLPPKGEANLLALLLAEAIPVYLRNAAVRAAALSLPFTASFAVKAGRTSATVRIGRRKVQVDNGIAGDALFVVEGEVENLLRVAAGEIIGQLRGIRVRPT